MSGDRAIGETCLVNLAAGFESAQSDASGTGTSEIERCV